MSKRTRLDDSMGAQNAIKRSRNLSAADKLAEFNRFFDNTIVGNLAPGDTFNVDTIARLVKPGDFEVDNDDNDDLDEYDVANWKAETRMVNDNFDAYEHYMRFTLENVRQRRNPETPPPPPSLPPPTQRCWHVLADKLAAVVSEEETRNLESTSIAHILVMYVKPQLSGTTFVSLKHFVSVIEQQLRLRPAQQITDAATNTAYLVMRAQVDDKDISAVTQCSIVFRLMQQQQQQQWHWDGTYWFVPVDVEITL